MEVENFLEPEIAVAAAVVAAVTSPQVRGFLRRGAVFGLAGVIAAGDALTTFTKGVGRGVQQATANGATAKRVPVEGNTGANGHSRRRRDTQANVAAEEGGDNE